MSASPWNRSSGRDKHRVAKGRRRAARPRLEALEARIVQTINASLFGGRLFVDGDSGTNVITLDHAGSTTTVNGQAFADSAITNGIEIRTGGNPGNIADTVNILGMVDETTVDAQGSVAFINLGDISGLNRLAKVSIKGLGLGVSGSTLNVVGAGDAQKRTITVDGNGSSGSITGLTDSASRNITFQSENLTQLNLFAGSGGNTVNIENTFQPEGGFFPTRAVFFNVSTGSGEDVVNIRGNNPKSSLSIHGQNGLDSVNIGRNGDTRGIEGRISIDNTGSFTNLNVDASADATPRKVDMRNTDFQALEYQIDGLTGSHGQLHNDTINFRATDINNLFIQAGGGGNTFGIQNTFKATSATSPSNTIINTGTGADVVTVNGTSGRLFLNGQAGLDTVNIGGSIGMQGIKGDIDVSNPNSLTDINLDNTANFSAHGVTVENVAASPGRSRVTGLSTGKVTFVANDVVHLNINAGAGVDTFFVRSTQGRTQTVINAGNGQDTFIVGNTDNSLDGIQGAVTLNGQGNGDSLQIIDNLATSPHTYTQTSSSLKRSGAAAINFSSIESLFIAKGPVSGNAPLVKNLKIARQLKRGQAGVLTGVLSDKDRKDKLSVTVDFGDGSAPVTRQTNRRPFAMKHKFAEAGAHTVRVVWTDTDGNSNFRDLTVNVAEKTPKATRGTIR